MKSMLFISLLLVTYSLIAQSDVYIYRGIVQSATGKPILYGTVFNKSKNTGSYTQTDGSFIIDASHGDTLLIRHLSFKDKIVVVSSQDYASGNVILLEIKNVKLADKIIYPWPSKERFKEVFLSLDLEDPIAKLKKTSLNQNRLSLGRVTSAENSSRNYRNYIKKWNYGR